MKNIKSKTYKIGGYSITRTKETNTGHYKAGKAAEVYSRANKNIPVKKSTIITTPKTMRTKVVDYSPVSYYGTQNKTKRTIVRKK